MAESKSKMESIREWIVEHKLRTVVADARLHAQGLTLAALAGAGLVEYYDHKSGKKADRYAKFLPASAYTHKD
ncbi:hypothetical protein RJ641_023685 [Dillenia turbinata]|uniref:Uncharacterized protein n=1 Tax=Dillenia turbinata TaxID=194707 RepID=A0AAN8UJE5_9MAGN